MPANIDISHPDKLLFPEGGITKRDVADYYRKIADYMLPYLKERPLTLVWFPEGIQEKGFFNKHAPDYFPDSIPRYTVKKKEDNSQMQMLGVKNAKNLVYLAGQNIIEFHIPPAKISDLEIPDQIIFDFDPADDDFDKVRQASLALRKLLDEWKIHSFVKTTGSSGMHVHIPIPPEHPFSKVKSISRKIAEKLQQTCPEITTLKQRKDQREDKVFIDYLRNEYSMTAVAPYSLRAKRGAPIATPLEWSEVEDASLKPDSYHIKNIFYRLGQKDDPWQTFNQVNTSLDILEIEKKLD